MQGQNKKFKTQCIDPYPPKIALKNIEINPKLK